jgi:diguanylate cyclase (GGDEF)-like protein/PAS domain S-box-containing protein
MKVRWKISLVVSATVLLAVLLMNMAYFLFFREYVARQESNSVNLIKETIASNIGERVLRYQGTANDWGHWTDVYNFLAGSNPGFMAANLDARTLADLDLNFMAVFDSQGMPVYVDYTFSDSAKPAPPEFLDHLDTLAAYAQLEEDACGLLRIGQSYYFVATSDVTDSDMSIPANGKLVVGRKFDGAIIENIEKTVAGTLALQETTAAGRIDEPWDMQLRDYVVNSGGNQMTINLLYAKYPAMGDSLLLSLVVNRDIYLAAMTQIRMIDLLCGIGFIVFVLVVISIVTLFMSRPITSLTRDVKAISLQEGSVSRIREQGRNEYSFLRQSINRMLAQIESEQKEVRDGQEKLRVTLSSVGDGVIAVNKDCQVDYMNPAAENLTGWQLAEAVGKPIEQVFRVYQQNARDLILNPAIDALQSGRRVELTDGAFLLTRDGFEKSVEDSAAPIWDQAGEIIGCVLVFHDSSEKAEKRRQIEYLSYHDQLTGLYNRRFFEEELRRLDAPRNLPITLLFADINGLKTINDGFGHYYGDLLISQFADSLKKTCRADDIVARIGGDEFVILLPHTDTTGVQKLVSRIRDKTDQVKIMDITLSVSFGWDTKSDTNQSIQDALKKSEDMMYQNKILSSYSKRNGIIKYILKSLLVKSPREEAHSQRVSEISREIGKACGIGSDEIKELLVAGELHDIGKIAIDVAILDKPGRLSDEEWEQIKAHPETGYRLLGSSLEYHSIARCVLAHHERWDGKGYPNGLAGDAIDWKARVIAVADAYDAMTSDRPYRPALSEDEAISEVKAMAGRQFDPDIARIFVTKVMHRRW